MMDQYHSYKNVSTHAQDLEGGRVLAPGEVAELTAEVAAPLMNAGLLMRLKNTKKVADLTVEELDQIYGDEEDYPKSGSKADKVKFAEGQEGGK
jgi:hypothetical protein